MAKLTRTLSGNLNSLMHKIKDGILEGSATATLEEVCTFEEKGARCGVMVFERYSYMGKNRVSMVTPAQTATIKMLCFIFLPPFCLSGSGGWR